MRFCGVVVLSEGLVPGSDLTLSASFFSQQVILERGLLVHLPAELHMHRSSPRLALAQNDGPGLWLAAGRLLVVVLWSFFILTSPDVAGAGERLHD